LLGGSCFGSVREVVEGVAEGVAALVLMGVVDGCLVLGFVCLFLAMWLISTARKSGRWSDGQWVRCMRVYVLLPCC
jgi:hypothetical protein